MADRSLLDETAGLWAIHLQPEDVPVLCHVLHPALIEDPSVFVNLNVLAHEQSPVVFGLPYDNTSRPSVYLGQISLAPD